MQARTRRRLRSKRRRHAAAAVARPAQRPVASRLPTAPMVAVRAQTAHWLPVTPLPAAQRWTEPPCRTYQEAGRATSALIGNLLLLPINARGALLERSPPGRLQSHWMPRQQAGTGPSSALCVVAQRRRSGARGLKVRRPCATHAVKNGRKRGEKGRRRPRVPAPQRKATCALLWPFVVRNRGALQPLPAATSLPAASLLLIALLARPAVPTCNGKLSALSPQATASLPEPLLAPRRQYQVRRLLGHQRLLRRRRDNVTTVGRAKAAGGVQVH
mmetsp:Transcript_23257/g.69088  ORF Transcript_23257/g.69088 Transcript_23257/m.69088 type:complete len:273 (+) Transcript_23257:767-1585(+)